MTGTTDKTDAIFWAALEIASPGERAAYLDQACGRDSQMRAQIEELVAAYPRIEQFLEQPPPGAGFTFERPETEQPGTQIGPYQLLEQIGEGGMGVVFRAQQHQPVRRTVALKVIKPGMDTRHVVTRFEAERQALALMDHPHIARILDAGATESGRPFFVMDLVRGTPVTDYADAHRLSMGDRLQLFITICQAVQHAHQKGIIHRDLKPSNILVTEQDGRPEPKIIDFGIAKAIAHESTGPGTTTALGFMLGTPQYMSPEQAACGTGSASGTLDVDTRSDVYSLGAVLYELLTGAPPLAVETLREAPFETLQRLIHEQEPPRPSDRLDTLTDQTQTVAEHRNSDPRQLARTLRGDLDWIVMKALEKDRSRRYESPAELARDIEHYLRHEPVLAGPPSLPYRLRKLVRRHRGPVVAGLIVLLALISGIVGTSIGLIRALDAEHAVREERTAAVAARKEVEAAHSRTRLTLDFLTDRAIGRILGQQSQFGPEERQFLKQIELHYQTLADAHGNTELSRVNQANGNRRVAQIRLRLGDHTGAEQCARQAIDLFRRLTADFPADPTHELQLAFAHNDLGMVFHEMGKLEEAAAAYRIALSGSQPAQDRNRPHSYPVEFAWTQNNLGSALWQLGRLEEAESVLRQVVNNPKGTADNPSVVVDRHQHATSIANLGFVLRDRGRLEESEATFRQSLAIWDRLIAEAPGNAARLDGRARTRHGLATALHKAQRYDEAEKFFQSVVTHRRQLASDYRAVPSYQSSLAAALCGLGDVHAKQGHVSDADRAYQESVAVYSKLLAGPQVMAEHENDAGHALIVCAEFAAAQQRHHEADELLRKTARVLARISAAHPNKPEYRKTYHRALLALAQTVSGVKVLKAEGWLADAERACRGLVDRYAKRSEKTQASSNARKLGESLVWLARVISAQRRHEEARPLFEQAIDVLETEGRADDDNNLRMREIHHWALRNFVLALIEMRDHRAAAAQIEQVAQMEVGGPRYAFEAAFQLGECVYFACRDARLPVNQKLAISARYAQKATSTLGIALVRTFRERRL